MKLKRVFATEMREAIRAVREELGPDAVILSNRSVDGGVEVLAGIDYEESVAGGGAGGPGRAARDVVEREAVLAPRFRRPPGSLSVPGSVPRVREREAADQPVPEAAGAAEAGPETPFGTPSGDSAAAPPAIDFARALGGGAANAAPPAAGPSALGSDRLAPARARGDQRRPGRPEGEPLLDPEPAPERARAAGRTRPSAQLFDLPQVEAELRSLRSLLEQQLCGLAWGDLARRRPVTASLYRRLLRLGLSRRSADRVAEESEGATDIEGAWRAALRAMERRVQPVSHDLLGQGGVLALVGPTGVGKTTTLAKLAARYRIAHGPNSVALLTADNYRVGAQEQLRTYGHLMGLPVAVCRDAKELGDAIERHGSARLVLVDTAGVGQRDTRLGDQLALLEAVRRRGAPGEARRLRCYAVLCAATVYSALAETVAAYEGFALDGCVITKIDETTSLGGVLSIVLEHRLPPAFLCDGQRVPEDLHPADARSLMQQTVAFARASEPCGEESVELAYGGKVANA